MAERAERREKRRLIDARFPQIKRIEDFRFADNPKVPQATIAALAEGSWIGDRESVIFVGDSGTGKTMLATALAVCVSVQLVGLWEADSGQQWGWRAAGVVVERLGEVLEEAAALESAGGVG